MSADEAVKERIINHMNQNHNLSLYDYLMFYNDIEVDYNDPKTKVKLTSFDLDSLTITYRQSDAAVVETTVVPIDPPMESLADSRDVLIKMAKKAASGFGFSPYRITKYLPPRLIAFDLIPDIFFTQLYFLALFPDLFFPRIADYSPELAEFGSLWIKPLVGSMLFTHALEVVFLMQPLFRKYRVTYPANLFWVISTFIEGYPAYFRFREEVKRVEH